MANYIYKANETDNNISKKIQHKEKKVTQINVLLKNFNFLFYFTSQLIDDFICNIIYTIK